MGNAALLTKNLLDVPATVTASSQESFMAANTLQTPHVSERWRSVGNSAFFVADKQNTGVADTVMIRGLTAGVNSTVRLRLSSSDSSGAAGDVLDTGDVTTGNANFDLGYGAFIYVLDAAQAWRYLRFDIFDPDGTYVEAGAICAGVRTQFTYNFSAGASVGWVDRSKTTETAGGQTQVWVDNTYRTISLNFNTVSEAQRYGLIEEVDRVNGQHSNVLFILDSTSTNLARDSIWGLVKDLTPVTQPQVIRLFGKTISINERL
jgi:hypothetical protein